MANNTIQNNIKKYMDATYQISITPDPQGGFVAEIEDLPGCLAQGETIEETMGAIKKAKKLWIETALEDEVEIPLPRFDQDYSGKWVQRVSKSLHRKLAEQARREGLSLNRYCEMVLTVAATSNDVGKSIYREFIRPGYARPFSYETGRSIRSLSSWTVSGQTQTSGTKKSLGVAA